MWALTVSTHTCSAHTHKFSTHTQVQHTRTHTRYKISKHTKPSLCQRLFRPNQMSALFSSMPTKSPPSCCLPSLPTCHSGGLFHSSRSAVPVCSCEALQPSAASDLLLSRKQEHPSFWLCSERLQSPAGRHSQTELHRWLDWSTHTHTNTHTQTHSHTHTHTHTFTQRLGRTRTPL